MYKLLTAVTIVVVFGVVGCCEREDERREIEEYCRMVAKWELDAAIGLPAHHRSGWAPYRKDITCK